ncbi:MAG TPA: hypothetical protein VF516_13465 [Kofleriaceae bacterium]
MSSEPQPSAPVSVDIVPGRLSARVHAHDIATQQARIPCWSYVTDGLAAHDQPEIVFTLRREPGEAAERFPDDPLRLFATIHELAERGLRVTAGSQTEFGDARLFDQHVLYVPAQPLSGVPLPPSCLTALLVTADELRAVRTFGPTRVLARMGQAAIHYPFPPWADRRRRGMAMDRTFEASALAKLPRASAQDVRVTLHGDRIVVSVLRVEPPVWPDRLAQLPDRVPLALLTAFDPTANGCLVWVPGQKEPEAIIPTGSDASRVCGCFFAVFADPPANTGKILEDGFAMQLTGEAWQALRRALIEGEELTIPAADGMSCALTWRDQADDRPVEASWQASAPEPPAERPGKVALGPVRLLTSEAEFAQRTSAEQLGAFCRELQRCVERVLADRDEHLELRLQVICRPRSHRVGLSHKGDASEDLLDALIDALEQVPTLPVRAEVSFEVELSVATGPRERFM